MLEGAFAVNLADVLLAIRVDSRAGDRSMAKSQSERESVRSGAASELQSSHCQCTRVCEGCLSLILISGR